MIDTATTTVVPAMNGHPRESGPGKCPYMTGGRSSEGRVDRWATPNVIHLARLHYASPPAIFILNTMSCIVEIMYAIVIEPKINPSY